MATVTITIENDEMNYDANECEAREYAAIINASIHHLKVKHVDKGEDVSMFLPGMMSSLEVLASEAGVSHE